MKNYDKPFSKTEHEALRSKGLQMDPLAGRQAAALQRPRHQVAHGRRLQEIIDARAARACRGDSLQHLLDRKSP